MMWLWVAQMNRENKLHLMTPVKFLHFIIFDFRRHTFFLKSHEKWTYAKMSDGWCILSLLSLHCVIVYSLYGASNFNLGNSQQSAVRLCSYNNIIACIWIWMAHQIQTQTHTWSTLLRVEDDENAFQASLWCIFAREYSYITNKSGIY